MIPIQYDLFESNDEDSIRKKEHAVLKESQDKLRKSMFSRFNDQGKEILFLKNELELLKKNLFKEKK